MAEVIDLLSSSPPRLAKASAPAAVNPPPRNDIFDLDSDVFDVIGELDFEVEQAPKRRKLSPSPALPQHSARLTTSREVNIFDLSSDFDILPDVVRNGSSPPKKTTLNSTFDVDDFDAFGYSSSAPEPSRKTSVKQSLVLELSSDHEPNLPDDPILSSSQPSLSLRPVLSKTTVNLLAGLRETNSSSTQKTKAKAKVSRSNSVDVELTKIKRFKQITKPSTLAPDDIVDSSQPDAAKRKTKAVSKPVDEDEPTKIAAKTKTKAERDAEREAEKERKKKEKELKAQEKQKLADIAEVNKSKTNKKSSTSEMIIDMPASLQNLSVGNQVGEYMKQVEVKVTFSRDEEIDLVSDNEVSLGNIIRWRRRITATFDEDQEIWTPLPAARVSHEKHILVYLKAEEFLNIALIGRSSSVKSAADIPESTMKTNLDIHVTTLRSRYPNNTLVYLIEGLAAWNRKSATVKNRAYTAAVRSQASADDPPSTSTTTTQARRTKPRKSKPQVDLSTLTPETTETLLLHLQLTHQPLLLHHTTSAATTASQILSFTQHLSTRPYRLQEQSQNLASASFCMATGQIRTGATPHETYINMLQEVNRVTPSMAYGISAAGYSDVVKLVKAFRGEGNLLLEDVRKSVNKDGAWSDRRLGPMVSKRLYRVFMGRDPGVRDGIA